MPDIQQGYQSGIGEAMNGMIADASLRDAASRQVEGGDIGWGIVVSQGTADDGIVIGGDAPIGITVADRTRLADKYVTGETASVLRTGAIWVTVYEAVNANNAVLYKEADGTCGKTAGAGIAALPNAVYETSAALGGLARVRIR